jgi:hypothetical protein
MEQLRALMRDQKIGAYDAFRQIKWKPSPTDVVEALLAFHPKQPDEPGRMTVPEYNRLTHEVIGRILEKIKEAGKVTSQDGSNLRQLINCHQLLPAEATHAWMRLCKVFVGDEPRLKMLHYFTGKLQPQPSPEQQYTLTARQVALLTFSADFARDYVDADLRDLQLALRVLPSLAPVFPYKDFNDAEEPTSSAAEPTAVEPEASSSTAAQAASQPSPASPPSAAQAADDEPDAKRRRID